MQLLPALEPWESTARSLHAAARLLGALRLLVQEPQKNYLELALRIEQGGLSTDTLAESGSVRLDLGRAALVYSAPGAGDQVIALDGRSQTALLETLLNEMAAGGSQLLRPGAGASFVDTLLAALAASRHSLKPQPSELTNDEPLAVDPTVSAGYGEALYRVFSAIARFRARLDGPQAPVVVWPEHFDLSTLWFATNDRSDSAPLMNFGFAPFDPTHPRPYLYAYAYPMPEGFAELPLPAPARWNSGSWKGLILDYDDLRAAADPEALIESTCEAVYALLAPGLH